MNRLFIICLFLSVLGFGQSGKEDSLLAVWNNPAVQDSSRLQAGLQLTWIYFKSDPVAAKEIIEKGITYAKAINDQANEAKYTRLMGVYHGMRREADDALKYFNHAKDLYVKLKDEKGEATCLMNIANVYTIQSKVDKSLPLYERVLAIRKRTENQNGVASVYKNMANAYYQLHDLESSLKYFFKSSESFLLAGDTVAYLNAQKDIASVYRSVGKTREALRIFLEAVPLAKKYNDLVALQLLNTDIGLVYLDLKQSDSALVYFIPAARLAEQFQDPSKMAVSYHNLGVIYQQLNQLDTALACFNHAIENRLLVDDREGLSFDYYNKGQVLIDQDKVKEGIDLCEQSLRLAKQVNSIQGKRFSCGCLSSGYEKLGNYEKALSYYKDLKVYDDSLNYSHKKSELVRQEAQFQYDLKVAADSVRTSQERQLKDAQIKAQQEQLKRQNFQRWILFGGIGVALLLSLFVYSRLRITRKQKAEIEHQREIVQTKNEEITHSIQYAQRLQSAIIPSDAAMTSALPQSFVIYKPKDIVAGDFYWLESFNDEVLFAVADCTGHGVPGAMVSIVCSNGLDRAVNELGLRDPAKILDATRAYVIDRFAKSESEIKDGMDIALCVLNKTTGELKFAGANNPLYLIKPLDDEVKEGSVQNDSHYVYEIKGDKQPIGKYRGNKPFVTHTTTVNKGDGIYIFTDGFADQFGGERGKKYKYKPFKQLVLDNFQLSSAQQKDAITSAFSEWKGSYDQIDDVCVVGLKL